MDQNLEVIRPRVKQEEEEPRFHDIASESQGHATPASHDHNVSGEVVQEGSPKRGIDIAQGFPINGTSNSLTSHIAQYRVSENAVTSRTVSPQNLPRAQSEPISGSQDMLHDTTIPFHVAHVPRSILPASQQVNFRPQFQHGQALFSQGSGAGVAVSHQTSPASSTSPLSAILIPHPSTRNSRKKHYAGFTSIDNPIPNAWRTIRLTQLARCYPNHLEGMILRRFIAEGWWDGSIVRAMHPDAREQIAPSGPIYLRKRLEVEKKMVEGKRADRAPGDLGFMEANVPHPLINWYRPQEVAEWREKKRRNEEQKKALKEEQARKRPEEVEATQNSNIEANQTDMSADSDAHTVNEPGAQQASSSRTQPSKGPPLPSRQHVDALKKDGSFTRAEQASQPQDVTNMMIRIWQNVMQGFPRHDDNLSREFVRDHGWSCLERSEAKGRHTHVYKSLAALYTWLRYGTMKSGGGNAYYLNFLAMARASSLDGGNSEEEDDDPIVKSETSSLAGDE